MRLLSFLSPRAALELQSDDWLTMERCWGDRGRWRTLETCSNWQHKLKLLFTSEYHNNM